MEMDIKTLTTGEIIDFIRTRRRVEHSITKEEKCLLLKELFSRGKESAMCDSTLHDVLYSLLPVSPNGNKKLQAQQVELANKLTSMLAESAESEEEDSDWDDPDWTGLSEKVLIDLLNIANDSSRPEALNLARTLYEELWYREAEEHVSENTLYTYLRRQIPVTSEKSFRPIAEKLIKAIIDVYD